MVVKVVVTSAVVEVMVVVRNWRNVAANNTDKDFGLAHHGDIIVAKANIVIQ